MDVPTAVTTIEEFIARGREDQLCRQVVVTGFHGLLEGHKDPRLKEMLNSADLWVPDGIAPVLVARLKGYRSAVRAPGADILTEFLERADPRGYRSFFYGDTDDTLARLRANLERDYPGHRVAGLFSPPFRPMTEEEDAEHVRMINESGADLLWVGLGTPKQDRWIAEHKDRLTVPVAAGVGAAFRFLAGTLPRAPEWMGRSGLEWLYRFGREPRKLWKRVFWDGPCFLALVALEMTGIRRYE